MKKEEVELIIIKVTADDQDVVNMKIYKDGTTCRSGVGGLPELGISGMSMMPNGDFFDKVIEYIPEDMMSEPRSLERETPNGSLEYVIAFYGVSKNGETGERADWEKATGIRIKIDQQEGFEHPLLQMIDAITVEATEITNEWYFDVVMKSRWDVLSSTLPKQTMIAQPNTPEQINEHYENYVHQMLGSARQWDTSQYVEGKTYEKDGLTLKGIVFQSEDRYSVQFVPVNGSESSSAPSQDSPPASNDENETSTDSKKPWWKLW